MGWIIRWFVNYSTWQISKDPRPLCAISYLPVGPPPVCPDGTGRALFLYLGCHLTASAIYTFDHLLRLRILPGRLCEIDDTQANIVGVKDIFHARSLVVLSRRYAKSSTRFAIELYEPPSSRRPSGHKEPSTVYTFGGMSHFKLPGPVPRGKSFKQGNNARGMRPSRAEHTSNSVTAIAVSWSSDN
jgi:hypothetical protein